MLLNRWFGLGHLCLRVKIWSIEFMLLLSGLAGLHFLGDVLGLVFFPVISELLGIDIIAYGLFQVGYKLHKDAFFDLEFVIHHIAERRTKQDWVVLVNADIDDLFNNNWVDVLGVLYLNNVGKNALKVLLFGLERYRL
jgi:hypothetical protein